MSDFQSQINKLVEEFVGQVTAVARQAAMDTLTSALGSAGGAAARRRAMEPTSAVAPAAPKAGGRRPKGAKRPQNEIEKTKERVNDFIHRNPGLRIEQINKELGTNTRDLSLPLKKLISEGAIRSEGEKRSTQYFPGDGGSKASRSEESSAAVFRGRCAACRAAPGAGRQQASRSDEM
jgi:hypothetical protein